MSNNEKTKKISSLVFHGLWLALSLTLWCAGLICFCRDANFGIWMVWGIMCMPPIIVPMLKEVSKQARIGRRRGANQYTATTSGNTIYVKNHPLQGAILGIIGGIIGCLIAGPIVLPLYMIKHIRIVISTAISLKNISE